MGADIKSLRTRIKSVNNTLHLTNAMGLVASSKIRKATIAMNHAKDYVSSIETISSILTSFPECHKSEYMKEHEGETRIIVIAGDRGLAGGYNVNVFKLMSQYPDAKIIPIGKKVCDKLKCETVECEKFSLDDANRLIKEQCSDFLENKCSKLGIISTEYISMMSQEPKLKWLLPLEKSDNKIKGSMIFEPDEESVLSSVVPQLLTGLLISSIKESFLCEVASRRMAMDSASKNATKMIEDLKLEYNRARQTSITQELTEIVAGSSL